MRGLSIILLGATCALVSGAERPDFQTLRYNEDWSFLHDSSQRTDWLDPAKFILLNGTDAYISFGGEARFKYERYDEPVLNQRPADEDGFLLQRYLFHAN